MTVIIILSLFILPFINGQSINDEKPVSHIRRDLRFMKLAKYDGYEAEGHFVTTKDGYILRIFRVKSRCETTKGEPMLLMHGLYLSGDDWIMSGPGLAHCYIYADACRDVWVANVRGNVYSRNHTTLNPDKDTRFWDFTLDEMSYLDLPVIMDYVLNLTGSKQLYYLGHSRGVAMLLLLCAKEPEYNAKVKAGFGMSTTAWLGHARFIIVKLQGLFAPFITPLINAGLNMEVLPRDSWLQPLIKLACGTSNATYEACSKFYFSILGYDRYQITPDVFPVLTGHIPSGTSLKDLFRYGQIRNYGFRQYDYGFVVNLKRYGSLIPPEYDLTAITMKWYFYASENDYVSDIKDLDILVPKVRNCTKCVLADKTFGHLDFLYGKDVPNYITPSILKYMDTGTFECL